MLEEQGIQPQPRRADGNAYQQDLGSDAFRKQPTPAYGWLLVLVLAILGGVSALSCLGLLAAGLLFARAAPAPPPAPAPMVAPAPQPAPPPPADRE